MIKDAINAVFKTQDEFEQVIDHEEVKEVTSRQMGTNVVRTGTGFVEGTGLKINQSMNLMSVMKTQYWAHSLMDKSDNALKFFLATDMSGMSQEDAAEKELDSFYDPEYIMSVFGIATEWAEFEFDKGRIAYAREHSPAQENQLEMAEEELIKTNLERSMRNNPEWTSGSGCFGPDGTPLIDPPEETGDPDVDDRNKQQYQEMLVKCAELDEVRESEFGTTFFDESIGDLRKQFKSFKEPTPYNIELEPTGDPEIDAANEAALAEFQNQQDELQKQQEEFEKEQEEKRKEREEELGMKELDPIEFSKEMTEFEKKSAEEYEKFLKEQEEREAKQLDEFFEFVETANTKFKEFITEEQVVYKWYETEPISQELVDKLTAYVAELEEKIGPEMQDMLNQIQELYKQIDESTARYMEDLMNIDTEYYKIDIKKLSEKQKTEEFDKYNETKRDRTDEYLAEQSKIFSMIYEIQSPAYTEYIRASNELVDIEHTWNVIKNLRDACSGTPQYMSFEQLYDRLASGYLLKSYETVTNFESRKNTIKNNIKMCNDIVASNSIHLENAFFQNVNLNQSVDIYQELFEGMDLMVQQAKKMKEGSDKIEEARQAAVKEEQKRTTVGVTKTVDNTKTKKILLIVVIAVVVIIILGIVFVFVLTRRQSADDSDEYEYDSDEE